MTEKQLDKSVSYLKDRGFDNPEIGIVLGSGLGRMADELEDSRVAHYHNIPNFPLATVEFHSGKLFCGTIHGKKAVVMQGRFHLYEGYNFFDITYPIRVMERLGIRKLLISNAAGAVNLEYQKGDLMLITDHINLQGGSPLAFKNVADFGERFVDMSCPYDLEMQGRIREIARGTDCVLREGVYAAVFGPQLETRAEYRMLGRLGADAVGMSTVPEVIVANHLKLPVAAISVITDLGDPDNLEPVNVTEILAVAARAEPGLVRIMKELIRDI